METNTPRTMIVRVDKEIPVPEWVLEGQGALYAKFWHYVNESISMEHVENMEQLWRAFVAAYTLGYVDPRERV